VPAKTPAPAVLLVHEWWGLNDQIKTMAAEFAKEGFLALAVDLYEGKVATNPKDAGQMMLTVFLRHDQSKNLKEINETIAKNGYFGYSDEAGRGYRS